MELSEILNIALPVVYVVVGIVLIWFVIELVMTVRKTRKTVTDIKAQLDPALESVNRMTADLEPTIKHVESITAQLEPAVAKVDPLVERVTLTVDAANLEIMRVDQILEDVTQITGSVSNTLDSVDAVTSAPLELVNSVTDKMRSRLKPSGASKESVSLGASKHAEPANAVRDFVGAVADTADAAVAERKERAAERKPE